MAKVEIPEHTKEVRQGHKDEEGEVSGGVLGDVVIVYFAGMEIKRLDVEGVEAPIQKVMRHFRTRQSEDGNGRGDGGRSHERCMS